MAQDFDESAAQPVSEVIAELRQNLGIPADAEPAAGEDDKKAGAADDDDSAATSDADDKSDDDAAGDDDSADDKDDAEEKAPPKKSAKETIFGKYKSEDELAEGWLHLQNSLSKMVKRLDSMEEKLTKKEGSDAPHPDIVALQDEAEDLQEDIKENRVDQQKLTEEAGGIRDKISTLKGRLSATEDEARKEAIQGQIDTLTESLKAKGNQWLKIDRDNKKLDRKVQSLESRRKQVEADIKEAAEADRESEQSVREWQEDQGRRFATAVKGLSTIYEMTPGQHARIGRIIKDEIKEYLQTHPKGDPIDVVKFVAVRAKEHTAEFNIKSKFVKKGDEKKEVSRQVGNGRTVTKEPTVRTKQTPNSQEKAAESAMAARLHARKILGSA